MVLGIVLSFLYAKIQFIINTQTAMYLSLTATTLEKSCFTHIRNQMHEALSKPMRKMTATHISLNTRTGKKLSF